MRNSITLLFLMVSCAANAQFSLQPQIGLENYRTTIRSNEFTCFSPLGSPLAARLGVRMNYTSKSGHGGFLGLATSNHAVELKFTDPQAVKTTYKASGKEIQLGIEGGYQFRSNPISLCEKASGKCKTSLVSNTSAHTYSEGEQYNTDKAKCGQRSYKSDCSKTSDNSEKVTTVSKGWNMRIIPSAGLAYNPSGESDIETETESGQTTYDYKAGWKTAFIAGTAFEFSKGKQSTFIISVNYLKGLGNRKETINTMANGKAIATSFQSKSSGFNISLGLPINLKKKNPDIQKKECYQSINKSRCGQYRIYNQ